MKLSPDGKYRMLQQVLAERFQMKAHMETREGPAYALVLAKSGPKLNQPGPNAPSESEWQFDARTGKGHWTHRSPISPSY